MYYSASVPVSTNIELRYLILKEGRATHTLFRRNCFCIENAVMRRLDSAHNNGYLWVTAILNSIVRFIHGDESFPMSPYCYLSIEYFTQRAIVYNPNVIEMDWEINYSKRS